MKQTRAAFFEFYAKNGRQGRPKYAESFHDLIQSLKVF